MESMVGIGEKVKAAVNTVERVSPGVRVGLAEEEGLEVTEAKSEGMAEDVGE